MKNTLLLVLPLILLSVSNLTLADKKIVPLEMDNGYWITTTEIEQSPMMKKILESIPEAQRESMLKMIESSMKSAATVEQCITADSFEDMEKKMRDAFSGNGDANNCDMNVTKSTSKEFVGELACGGQSQAMTIHTKVVNSKLHESTVVSVVPGMGENTIKSTGKWQSAKCPDGVK